MHTQNRQFQRLFPISLMIGLLSVACKPSPSAAPGLVEEHHQARAALRSVKLDLKEAEGIEAERRKEYERLAARLAELRAVEAERQASLQRIADGYDRYQAALRSAEELGEDCLGGLPPEHVRELYRYLATFESSPERDQAIERLEPCRRILVKGKKKLVRETAREMRAEFAVEIEDTFDENNPYSRGHLTATVRGDSLIVNMRGNYEGRRRHSQEQVDSWCSQSVLFAQITLRNSHGTFRCRPGGSMKRITTLILTEDGLLPAWTPAVSGPKATPTAFPSTPPPPRDGPDERILAQQAVLLHANWEAATANSESRREAVDDASAVAKRLEDQIAAADQTRRQDLEDSGRKVQLGGYVVGGMGVLSTAIGAYLIQSRSTVRAEIESASVLETMGFASDTSEREAKAERQTLGIQIGLGVGIPLVATGALLVLLGRMRKDRATSLALGSGGLVLKF